MIHDELFHVPQVHDRSLLELNKIELEHHSLNVGHHSLLGHHSFLQELHKLLGHHNFPLELHS